jgi:hypothetical protein
MPDWKKLVGEHLSHHASEDASEEVIAELAAHLEDDYEEGIESGLAESEATNNALSGIRWRTLVRKIRKARLDHSKPEGTAMNQRTKKLWLPALSGLTLTAVLLVVFDKVHASPLVVNLGHLAMMLQLAWFATMTITGQTKLEETLMNQRTRSVWLPGFVSLTAAGLFLFAEEIMLVHDSSFYFTDWNWPQHLISGLPLLFYCGWLLAQVMCGALGAFLSRRGGGSRSARLVAGAFPAMVMFGLCAVVIPVSALFEHKVHVFDHPRLMALGILIWAGAPAVALLAGAAPFLKELPCES